VSTAVGPPILRGIQAGMAGAVALAVVLALMAPPLTAAEQRARKEATEALARSGVTPVGGPVVVGERSFFDDPGAAAALALGCAVVGAVAGIALGWAARRSGLLTTRLAPVLAAGVLLTVGGLAATGRLRSRELLAFGAFWAVTTAAVLLGERSLRPRPPT